MMRESEGSSESRTRGWTNWRRVSVEVASPKDASTHKKVQRSVESEDDGAEEEGDNKEEEEEGLIPQRLQEVATLHINMLGMLMETLVGVMERLNGWEDKRVKVERGRLEVEREHLAVEQRRLEIEATRYTIELQNERLWQGVWA